MTLRQWDGFLTFVIKVTGSDTRVAELRDALFGILIDERFALTEALASPDASVQDPVRPLFLRTWERLAPVLREVGDALPAEQAMRYLSFVSAGDALQALDQLGPESGIEISADGLRRLARIVAPATLDDPLQHGVEVDPALRDLFGFGPPLPAPEENPDVDAGLRAGAEPAAASEPEPQHRSRSRSPSRSSRRRSPQPEPGSAGARAASRRAGSWFGGVAWAADEPDKEIVKRLNSWAPTRADIAEYAPLARQLLESVTTWLLARHEIDPAHEAVFRALVPATAWKESCWRQFVQRGGKLATLTSSSGSVGIMQVNVAVWRGFYEVNGLKRDIAYNARAGGEILEPLLDGLRGRARRAQEGRRRRRARARHLGGLQRRPGAAVALPREGPLEARAQGRRRLLRQVPARQVRRRPRGGRVLRGARPVLSRPRTCALQPAPPAETEIQQAPSASTPSARR